MEITTALIITDCLQSDPKNRPKIPQILSTIDTYLESKSDDFVQSKMVNNQQKLTKSDFQFVNGGILGLKGKIWVRLYGGVGTANQFDDQGAPSSYKSRRASPRIIYVWFGITIILLGVITLVLMWFELVRNNARNAQIAVNNPVPPQDAEQVPELKIPIEDQEAVENWSNIIQNVK